MKKMLLPPLFLFGTLSFVLNPSAYLGNPGPAEVKQLIFQKDSLFWVAYNNCDVEGMASLVSDDVEFYHDKGGVSMGKEALVASIKNNLCNNPNFHIRREAVEGSVEIFTLNKGDSIYGAIISGQHYFYINEKGKKESRDGLAKFSQLWLLKDGAWKMHRILSYDHRDATFMNTRTPIVLPDNILNTYVGTYKGPQSGLMSVVKKDGLLQLSINHTNYLLHPQTRNSFFFEERDLVFNFDKTSMTVVEKGKEVERAVKQ